MNQGRSVPARGQGAKNGQKGPQLQALMPLKGISDASRFEIGIMRVTELTEKRRFSAAC
jgi:hypothetical protein